MRVARRTVVIKGVEQHFHVVSRVVDRRKIFGEAEKEQFYRLMRNQEAFSGIQILGYCLMGNHFHLLLRVPAAPVSLNEHEVIKRLRCIYSDVQMDQIRLQLEEWRKEGNQKQIDDFFDKVRARMYDLSDFVKDLKQRFSTWYNQANERKGTLWEERFKSVLVEGSGRALMRVMAYIDLNPVRAGIAQAAASYSWSSFSEAVKGNQRAREGLLYVVSAAEICPENRYSDWKTQFQKYSDYLSLKLSRQKNPMNYPQNADQSDNPIHDRGVPDHLFEKQRYLIEGLILGSYEFIQDHYNKKKRYLCQSRKYLCWPAPGEGCTGLHTYRQIH